MKKADTSRKYVTTKKYNKLVERCLNLEDAEEYARQSFENIRKQNVELLEHIERLQEQLNEANAIIEDMRPFIQGSMSRQTYARILNYEDKWGVK